MTTDLKKLSDATECEIRFDGLTRQLYSTDASIYQIEPYGVAFPRSARQCAAVMRAAANDDIPLIPRGGGTGLAGGAVGEGLIINAARYNREITDLNVDARTVRVGAGVVLDQLNLHLMAHGLCFGPDVATSSRATLGGMIANNSSGARTPYYGTTIDHVRSLQVVLADGTIAEVGIDHHDLQDRHEIIQAILAPHEAFVREHMHDGIIKRWPGYGLDRYFRSNGDLARIFGGSEGTLATIFSAELNLCPLPRHKGVGIIFFPSVTEAMAATVDILDLNPAAIEHVDDVLFDQTLGQLAFRRARAILDLDTRPCKAFLIVEFYDHVEEKLQALDQKKLGLRTLLLTNPADMAHVWNLRKAGLSLLTGRPGDAKPTAGIEDAAVPPAKLPDYVRGLQDLMEPLGLEASYYGHAASGLLHVRPVVDMHTAEGVQKFRSVCDGVAALVKQFKGALAAEHGVGIARTEYMADQLGPELITLMTRVKKLFDPDKIMNPGKIIPGEYDYRIDTHLRQGAGSTIPLHFEPVLAFAAKDKSFIGNLEQCNGCGGCTKTVPTMCPTYLATGEEIMSTRGRANTIRAALEGRLAALNGDPLLARELEYALSNCLSCKACTSECPSNVNMALLKAELIHARQRRHGVSLRDHMISRVDLIGWLGSRIPGLANASLQWQWLRALLEKTAGFAAARPLPRFTDQPFDAWFHRRTAPKKGDRGRVLLWDDCFCRYYDSQIGRAAVRVLEAAGYEVRLPEGRKCCGRPAFSAGRLDLAARWGAHNLGILGRTKDPVIFLEPSCYSMFAEDYRELKLEAQAVAGRCFLFEQFVERAMEDQPGLLPFDNVARTTAIHAHCHAKSITDVGVMATLANRMPNNHAALMPTGCCGMAGAFGAAKEKYDLSLQVAAPLVKQIEALPADTCLVASGTSCRHQIEHLTDRRPLHMAELLAEALETKED
ncbi:MAG: FAD-binding protein [Candidatus Hydrogenedentes bacterium]|nr:FAD-binding protein [Candidatus Hydrogenedentota bacterium]